MRSGVIRSSWGGSWRGYEGDMGSLVKVFGGLLYNLSPSWWSCLLICWMVCYITGFLHIHVVAISIASSVDSASAVLLNCEEPFTCCHGYYL